MNYVSQRQRRALLLTSLLFVTSFGMAAGAGPRWVADTRWVNNGKPMGWYRPDTRYFVDQGALSASVDNATATALVDAAASVWNVQGVNFSLTDGGQLAEDVSSNNVYLGANGLIWPADVQSTNYLAKQIAVLFDADGSITDTLLGSGASAPSNCRQNGVTESVDLFINPGSIAHAIIVVNGRCTGPAPEQQLQLQYQLERVFGRVIGIGWSQTNDNVFTGTPAPTYVQQAHWPIMHPIDILCGPYTYQCLPMPFTLRDDDLAALEMVYAADLTVSPPNHVSVSSRYLFPNGQGMGGVNVVVQRTYPFDDYGTDPYQDVSSVTGFLSPTDVGNPVHGAPTDSSGTGGGSLWYGPGYFLLYGIPSIPREAFTGLTLHAEAVNPLYSGQYSVGPYRQGSPSPSGTVSTPVGSWGNPGASVGVTWITVPDATSECNPSSDGVESAPSPLPADGFWSGRFCGMGHTPWSRVVVKTGRTATIEVTSLDESGTPTETKARPVVGLWHGQDATGTLPTLERAITPFNATSAGMTQMRATFTANEAVRVAIADQRGDGRPDYVYRARFLYADTVSPARMLPGGGTIQVTGTGFTTSSVVTVGGVLAPITNLSATQITATAPTLDALGSSAINDVTVTDRATGADTTISGGITYSGAAGDVLALVQGPPSSVAVGSPATLRFKLVDGTGAPALNSTITVAVVAGSAQLSTCGLASCTLLTDATGFAQAQITPTSAGLVQLQALARSGSSVQASFNATQSLQTITFVRPTEYVAAGAGAVFSPGVVLSGSNPQAVQWSANSPRLQFARMQAGGNTASVSAVSSLNDNESATVQACVPGSLCGTQSIVAIPAAQLRVLAIAGDGQSVAANASLDSVAFRTMDMAGHPVAGVTVAVHQEVTGWQAPCATEGRCPPAPVYGIANTTMMSDDDGLISVTPLQYTGTAATTRITATAGTDAAATATLEKTP